MYLGGYYSNNYNGLPPPYKGISIDKNNKGRPNGRPN